MLIAIEGVDASGKNTVTSFLADYLTKIRVLSKSIAFPRYDGPIGPIIKNLLKDPTSAPELKQAAMLADRLGAIDMLMEGAQGHNTVVCDRYCMSGIVYGIADGLNEPWLYQMHKVLPEAKLQILLDIDPEEAARRRGKPRDANETNFVLLNRVRQLYLDIWKTNRTHQRGTWRIIDASQHIEIVKQQVADAYHEAVATETFVCMSNAAQ